MRKQFESHPREMEKWECEGFGFKSHDANDIFPTLHMRTRLRIRPEVRSDVRTPQTSLGPKDGEERCAGILAVKLREGQWVNFPAFNWSISTAISQLIWLYCTVNLYVYLRSLSLIR